MVGTAKRRQRTTYEYGRIFLRRDDAAAHAVATLQDMDGEATACVNATSGVGRHPGMQVASWIKLASGKIITLRDSK